MRDISVGAEAEKRQQQRLAELALLPEAATAVDLRARSSPASQPLLAASFALDGGPTREQVRSSTLIESAMHNRG